MKAPLKALVALCLLTYPGLLAAAMVNASGDLVRILGLSCVLAVTYIIALLTFLAVERT